MWPFSASGYPIVSLEEAGTPLEEKDAKSYDYIVVGGGTAGCCLASRLSEDPSISVLLLERGRVHDAWFSRIPLMSQSDTTGISTPLVKSPSVPLKEVGGKVLNVGHAEALGGGSAVNAMLVTRGAVGDFDHWAQLGHPSWDYASLRPYFIKSEKSLSQTSGDRGYSGPWVNQTFRDLPFKIQSEVKNAASSLGFADVVDFNASNVPVDALATLDTAIDSKMRRMSAYHTFLPATVAQERREHLKICTETIASKIVIEASVAVGVMFESADNSKPRKFHARARREVVVCCGAIGSPHLLLLSGIGPKEQLEEKGIEMIKDLVGVGARLEDHLDVVLMYDVPLKDTLHHIENSIWAGVLALGNYFLGRKSLMGTSIGPIAIFAHSSHLHDVTAAVLDPISGSAPGSNRPDLEIMPIAHWCSEPPPYKIRKGVFSFLLCLVQPKSFGFVRLASSDPRARPEVDFGYLTNPDDLIPLRKGIKLALRLGEKVRAQGYPMKDFQVPSSEADNDLDNFIRTHLGTAYHYTSTCRMAREEDGGVVDDDLKVYGVHGLRVCDASVFPCITSAHTMTPVIAVAERCADLIKNIR
ncbi:alcohol oxidase [Mycena galericulata]|nr:alcohol oxidase [Mycena galericulata]